MNQVSENEDSKRLLDRLAEENFYGIYQIHFKAGKVTHVKLEKTFQVDDLQRVLSKKSV